MSEIHQIISCSLLLLEAILVGAISSFVILFITVSGIRDMVVTHAPKLISRLFECNFCLSFWTSLIVAISLVTYTGDSLYLVTPIIVSPILRYL